MLHHRFYAGAPTHTPPPCSAYLAALDPAPAPPQDTAWHRTAPPGSALSHFKESPPHAGKKCWTDRAMRFLAFNGSLEDCAQECFDRKQQHKYPRDGLYSCHWFTVGISSKTGLPWCMGCLQPPSADGHVDHTASFRLYEPPPGIGHARHRTNVWWQSAGWRTDLCGCQLPCALLMWTLCARGIGCDLHGWRARFRA